MIKKLKKKFIVTAISSTAIVLILLISAINIINYVNTNKKINVKLDMLAENQGMFPLEQFNKPEMDFIDDRQPPNDKLGRRGPENLSLETPFETRYFTIECDVNGNVVNVFLENIASVTEEQAKKYFNDVIDKSKKTGYEDTYKYKKVELSNGNTMVIFLDCERDISSFEQFLLASVLISLVGLILVGILIFILSGRIIKPMAESYEKQKRFITDASHELKTPLTIIDANTEVIEMETGENEWTKSIHSQIGRLSDLTNKLVFLSRMDEEKIEYPMTDFSLSKLMENTIEPYDAIILSGNKKLELDIEDDINMYGDEDNIKKMVELLMDNAIKYSEPESEIVVKLEKKGKRKMLSFVNVASNIEKGKHNEFFERFYRGDSSRNSSKGGHGIGLSVVKAIVDEHKGKIIAQSTDGKHFEISVLL